MLLHVGCEFIWKSEVATAAIVQVEPRPDASAEVIAGTWRTDPDVASRQYRDGFGNLCRRVTLPAGRFGFSYDGQLRVSDEVDEADETAIEVAPKDLPDEALAFTLPSRFCQPDVLADAAWTHFGTLEPGYTRVQAICDFVHRHLTWQPGTSSPTTTALDVYHSHTGVCRDFAHLAITFCRALNIPARYAFGYLADIDVPPSDVPMDFCAWIEVFLGDRWYTFDPRNNARRRGRGLIGRGRDAVDVAMTTTYGGPELVEMVVWADALVDAAR